MSNRSCRVAHFIAGIFSGFMLWRHLNIGIILILLFNFFQYINVKQNNDWEDYMWDTWDFMCATFIGAGLGFILNDFYGII